MDTGDLDLEIAALTGPGRRPAQLEYSVVRPLQGADLALLAANAGIEPISIKKLSERHHALARLLASGAAPAEAAIITGYELSRVSVLRGDPSFVELVEFYREKVDVEFSDTISQLAGMSKDIILELRRRIEDAGEEISTRELRELLTAGLDRTGFGPTHKQVQEVNINLSSRLDEARRRALEARREMIRDITPSTEEADQSPALFLGAAE